MTSSFNRIDGESEDAPHFAGYGAWTVGVETLSLPYRGLVVEHWYPADCDNELTSSDGIYDTLLRDGATPIRLFGRAKRGLWPWRGTGLWSFFRMAIRAIGC